MKSPIKSIQKFFQRFTVKRTRATVDAKSRFPVSSEFPDILDFGSQSTSRAQYVKPIPPTVESLKEGILQHIDVLEFELKQDYCDGDAYKQFKKQLDFLTKLYYSEYSSTKIFLRLIMNTIHYGNHYIECFNKFIMSRVDRNYYYVFINTCFAYIFSKVLREDAMSILNNGDYSMHTLMKRNEYKTFIRKAYYDFISRTDDNDGNKGKFSMSILSGAEKLSSKCGKLDTTIEGLFDLESIVYTFNLCHKVALGERDSYVFPMIYFLYMKDALYRKKKSDHEYFIEMEYYAMLDEQAAWMDLRLTF